MKKENQILYDELMKNKSKNTRVYKRNNNIIKSEQKSIITNNIKNDIKLNLNEPTKLKTNKKNTNNIENINFNENKEINLKTTTIISNINLIEEITDLVIVETNVEKILYNLVDDNNNDNTEIINEHKSNIKLDWTYIFELPFFNILSFKYFNFCFTNIKIYDFYKVNLIDEYKNYYIEYFIFKRKYIKFENLTIYNEYLDNLYSKINKNKRISTNINLIKHKKYAKTTDLNIIFNILKEMSKIKYEIYYDFSIEYILPYIRRNINEVNILFENIINIWLVVMSQK